MVDVGAPGQHEPVVLTRRPGPPVRRSRATELGIGMMAVFVAAGGVVAVVSRSAPPPTVSASVITTAVARTSSVRSAAFTSTSTASAGGQSLTVVQRGVLDLRHHASEVTLMLSGEDETIRTVGKVAYLKWPRLVLPAGKSWVRQLPEDLGLGSSSLAPAGHSPSESLQLLRGVTGDATVEGHDVVAGVPETRYGIHLDLADLFKRVGTATGSVSPKLAAELTAALSHTDLSHLPATVWIDDAQRLRRLTMKLSIRIAGHTVHDVTDLAFTSFDEPVDIGAPPASETVPYASVKDQIVAMVP